MVAGSVPAPDRVQGVQDLGAELSRVDFGEDGPRDQGTRTWNPQWRLLLGTTPPVSPPLGFRFRPLPVLRDSVWFLLGWARGQRDPPGWRDDV